MKQRQLIVENVLTIYCRGYKINKNDNALSSKKGDCMSKFFLKTKLSTGKDSIIDRLFNEKSEELAEGECTIPIGDKERFLDMVSNVKDESLRQRLIHKYLKDEDYLGAECGRLIKNYYRNRIR